MDLKLLLKGYHEEVENVEMAEMKKRVIEDRLLLEANKKLEMNRMLSKFGMDEFVGSMNKMCKVNSMVGIKTISRLGKNHDELEKSIVFRTKDENELIVVFQVLVNEVNGIDLDNIGTFVLGVCLNESAMMELNRFNGLAELARYLDELAVDGKLNEIVGVKILEMIG
ncbi:MAG: hypothetical protein ACRC5T_06450 [Cetobacterium sp.]